MEVDSIVIIRRLLGRRNVDVPLDILDEEAIEMIWTYFQELKGCISFLRICLPWSEFEIVYSSDISVVRGQYRLFLLTRFGSVRSWVFVSDTYPQLMAPCLNPALKLYSGIDLH